MSMFPGRSRFAQRQKELAQAQAFPQGIRCQKCLEYGHWSYECKNKRKYVYRSSRTQQMKKKLKQQEENSIPTNGSDVKKVKDEKDSKKKKKKSKSSSESSSSSSSSDSSDSSSSSSSSDSETDSSSDSSSSSDSD